MKTFKIVAGAVLVLVMAVAMLLVQPLYSSKPLPAFLQRATQFPPLAGVTPDGWTSQHEALFSTFDRLGMHHWVRFDTASRSSSPLTALSEHGSAAVRSPAISPDGQRVLWFTEQSGIPTEWHVARLDGSREVKWPLQRGPLSALPGPASAWASDSRHWVDLDVDNAGAATIRVHDALHSNRFRAVALKGGALSLYPWDAQVMGLVSGGRILVASRHANNAPVAAVSANRFLVASRYAMNVPAAMTLTTVDPRTPSPTVQSHVVKLPTGTTLLEAQLSPQGDMVAMLLCNGEHRTGFSPFDGLRDKLGVQPWTQSLCTCRVDGSDLRCVGTIDTIARRSAGMLRWMPDGKHVSFGFAGNVWLVGVR